MTSPGAALIRLIGIIAMAAGLYALIGGAVSICGWVLDIHRLTDWSNDGVSIQPNTCILMMLSGAGVCLLVLAQSRIVVVLGALVATGGGLILLQYIVGADFGFNHQLLFGRTWGQSTTLTPGRMGPPASCSFLLVGTALVLLSITTDRGSREARGARGSGARVKQARRLVPVLALTVASITMFSLLGYLFGAEQFYSIPWLSAIALPTATMLLALALGVIVLAPQHDPMRLLLEKSAAGAMARLLLPMLIVLPPLVLWARIAGYEHGYFDLGSSRALGALVLIAAMVGVVWVALLALRQREHALERAREAAENVNRAKDRFLAVLSHELRTPLTPVLLSVNSLQREPALPASVRDSLEMIQRNVELETKLIDDLLDLSRITAGKLRLKMEAVEMNSAVRRVCDTCRQSVQEKGIRLHCDLPAQPLRVKADPARLQQVLWNVVKNAAKFTPQRGEIFVTVSRTDTGRVRAQVRDTGVGIEPEVLPKIFDAFEQGDPGITREFGGLGLGLAISKALVEMHHGTIRVHSAGRGRGATFTIELPALAGPIAPAPAAPSNGDGRLAPLRVLVVEDHADTAAALRALLRSSGFTVTVAHTAAEALESAATEPFDIMLSDIGLPDATGYELMRQLKARYATKGIAMSGFGMEEDLRKSREAGFSDHIIKPANFTELEHAIRRIANGD